jgi:tRNA(fMet)-specific endonuclease VapC
MSLYVLDTDHLTLLRYGNAEVAARLKQTPEDERATTIISVEEQLRGWFTQVRKAREVTQLARLPWFVSGCRNGQVGSRAPIHTFRNRAFLGVAKGVAPGWQV